MKYIYVLNRITRIPHGRNEYKWTPVKDQGKFQRILPVKEIQTNPGVSSSIWKE